MLASGFIQINSVHVLMYRKPGKHSRTWAEDITAEEKSSPPMKANWMAKASASLCILASLHCRLEEAASSDFTRPAQLKFFIPENTVLKVPEEQGIEVEEDVFPELAAVREVRFLILTDDACLPEVWRNYQRNGLESVF
ncbi:hypothetical protein AOLI_G00027890 [Acnodon oligacanthus]